VGFYIFGPYMTLKRNYQEHILVQNVQLGNILHELDENQKS